MSSTAASTRANRATDEPEQLSLLTSPVNPRFVLSRETRARGLRHVAEIRQLLATRTTGADHPRRAA